MLATLSDRRDLSDADDEWVLERRLDGVRVPAVREGERVTLLSRSGRRLNDTYPEIVGRSRPSRVPTSCSTGRSSPSPEGARTSRGSSGAWG
ncbi:hypothetical protein [Streptomyces coeruleorubidus]|uniref:hypothetical protein n=1 Tax=Streptomyces coeruleorubidus TaxID=116188 RepID=UPI003F541279